MKKGKILTIKQVLKSEGKKVVVSYPYREDLVMNVSNGKLADEKGEYTIDENSDVTIYECVE